MAAISPVTRETIKGYLEGFIYKLVEQHAQRKVKSAEELVALAEGTNKKSKKRGGKFKPFHAAIIPEEVLRISAFERSFSTSLGSTFEECARLIALEHHADAQRSFDVKGSISQDGTNEIEHQVETFEHAAEVGHSRPTLNSMVQAVLDARQTDDERLFRVRADLYIRKHNGEELFFEMKSPVPNKGQCLEVTQRILRFHLLRGQPRPQVQGYFAMTYNPFGPSRDDYEWSMARNYLPFEEGVLIGQEFWDVVGGPSAYEELLEVYQEVGREKSKYIIDSLAFGF
jgi:hypothetical protein